MIEKGANPSMIEIPARGDREEWFTTYMMGHFRAQGLSCLHIKETEKPGAADVLVWSGAEIVAWTELKVDNNPIEPAQREFLRARDAEAGNAFVIQLDRKEKVIRILRGYEGWGELGIVEMVTDPTKIAWKNWFWRNRRDIARYK